MRKRWIAFALLLCSRGANAHRLDELLQATLLSLQPGTVQVTLRLIPGVAVAPAVIASIDTDHDGILSPEEQRRFARLVSINVHLAEDGRSLPLHLEHAAFPAVEEMKEGTGEISLVLLATLPASQGQHTLSYQNRFQQASSVYLVNSLVPKQLSLRLGVQTRNQNQSDYAISFEEGDASSNMPLGNGLHARHVSLIDTVLLLLTLVIATILLVRSVRRPRQAH